MLNITKTIKNGTAIAVICALSSTSVIASEQGSSAGAAQSGANQSVAENGLFLLASPKILKENLSAIGFDHFAEKTNLHERLGGTQKYLAGVRMALMLAELDYFKSMEESPLLITMHAISNDIIIESILKGSTKVEKK